MDDALKEGKDALAGRQSTEAVQIAGTPKCWKKLVAWLRNQQGKCVSVNLISEIEGVGPAAPGYSSKA